MANEKNASTTIKEVVLGNLVTVMVVSIPVADGKLLCGCLEVLFGDVI